MSHPLFYFKFNVDSPEAHRVILTPKETTLYTSGNWQASILEKGPHAWKQNRTTI